MSRKMYLCKVPKSSITLKPALWACGSRAAEGFPQLGKLSDCEEASLYLFSGHFRHYSLVKLKLQCAGHGMNSQGQSSSLLPVICDLSAGCEQAEMTISPKNIDLNAQGRETPGKYKSCCSHVCTRRFVLISLCPLASSLPEDLD